MNVCIAHMRGEAIMLTLQDSMVFINEEIQPIKGLTEDDIKMFAEEIARIPYSTDAGYTALVNARRAAFLSGLLGKAVGEECVNRISHILDSVHYDVLHYLGEVEE